MLVGSGEARTFQRCLVVRKLRGVEACKKAEDQVEGTDVEASGKAHWAYGNAEVGDEPERVWAHVPGETRDQEVDFRLTETVEKEVSDHQINLAGWGEGKGVLLDGLQAYPVRRAATAEELEHGRAGINSYSVERRIGSQELRQKATVAVAKDQSLSPVEEERQEVGAGSLEEGAEREVFQITVRPGDAVEVRLVMVWSHQCDPRRKTSGVRRARSAAALRVRGEKELRRECRTSSRIAARQRDRKSCHGTRVSRSDDSPAASTRTQAIGCR